MWQQAQPGIPAQRKQQIVLSVAALLPVSRCCMYDIGEDIIARGHVVHNGETKWIQPYRSEFHDIDPFAPRQLLSKRGRRMYGTGFGDALSAIQKTDYYHGFMKPMGQLHKIDLLLAGPCKVPIVGLRLSRTDRLGPFTASERSMLERLIALLDLTVGSPLVASHVIGGLTGREQDVTRLLVKGYTNKEIGLALDLQLATVKTHVMNLFRKIGARNRADLVRRILT